MPITIGSNIAALQAQRRLNQGGDALARVYERLSSGQRINRAADDAAGLSIAAALNAQSRVLTQAMRNGNDALSALGIADGAYEALGSVTTRIAELSEEAANGTYDQAQRRALDSEAQALRTEFSRIVSTAKFNGINLLDGSAGSLAVQVGIDGQNGSRIDMTLQSAVSRAIPDGTFQAATQLFPINFIVSMKGVDADHDGDTDLFLAIQDNNGSIQYLRNNGNGTFATPLTVDGGAQPSNLTLADVNGDGLLDAVEDGGNDAGWISVNLGTAPGTFAARVTFSSGMAGVASALAGDVNGDGKIDLIAAHNNEYSVLFGNGDGTFKAAVTRSADISTITAVADLNGDGRQDLVAIASSTVATQVFLANSDGTFAAPGSYGSYDFSSSIADMNGDGRPDIVTSNWNADSLQLLLNQGGGTFSVGPQIPTGTLSVLSALGDINGDGIPDIVSYTEDSAGPIHVFTGNGDGTFKAGVSYSGDPAQSRNAIALLDVNGDGALDILSTSDSGTGTNVYYANVVQSAGMRDFNLLSAAGARDALDLAHSVIGQISSQRSIIGALESRVAAAINNDLTANENVSAARSRIMDADIASEASQLTRIQILQQAGSAVLAQANQQPTLALTLLRG